jgi:hypothetical protein
MVSVHAEADDDDRVEEIATRGGPASQALAEVAELDVQRRQPRVSEQRVVGLERRHHRPQQRQRRYERPRDERDLREDQGGTPGLADPTVGVA